MTMSRRTMIYVDSAIFPWRGRVWAHLFSEDLDALHGFAQTLGIARERFQAPPKASWPHYDVTAALREEALLLGAVAADRQLTVEVTRRIRAQYGLLRMRRAVS